MVKKDVDTLVAMYQKSKETGKNNPWFGRSMKQLPIETQNKVWEKISHLGFEISTKKKRVRKTKPETETEDQKEVESRIYWRPDEWDKLADIVWQMRSNDQVSTLVNLVNRALSQFPEDRRRSNLTSNQLQPLIERMEQRQKHAKKCILMEQELKSRLENVEVAPSREEVLRSLTDEELYVNYRQRFLDMLTPAEMLDVIPTDVVLEELHLPSLIGFVAQSVTEELMGAQKKSLNRFQEIASSIEKAISERPQTKGEARAARREVSIPRMGRKSKPRVAVFGALANQQREIQNGVEDVVDVTFFDKNRQSDLRVGLFDIYVVWTRFVSHSIDEQVQTKTKDNGAKLIRHRGGITKMIEAIREEVGSVEASSIS